MDTAVWLISVLTTIHFMVSLMKENLNKCRWTFPTNILSSVSHAAVMYHPNTLAPVAFSYHDHHKHILKPLYVGDTLNGPRRRHGHFLKISEYCLWEVIKKSSFSSWSYPTRMWRSLPNYARFSQSTPQYRIQILNIYTPLRLEWRLKIQKRF